MTLKVRWITLPNGYKSGSAGVPAVFKFSLYAHLSAENTSLKELIDFQEIYLQALEKPGNVDFEVTVFGQIRKLIRDPTKPDTIKETIIDGEYTRSQKIDIKQNTTWKHSLAKLQHNTWWKSILKKMGEEFPAHAHAVIQTVPGGAEMPQFSFHDFHDDFFSMPTTKMALEAESSQTTFLHVMDTIYQTSQQAFTSDTEQNNELIDNIYRRRKEKIDALRDAGSTDVEDTKDRSMPDINDLIFEFNQHPELMRELGLILDFDIEASIFTKSWKDDTSSNLISRDQDGSIDLENKDISPITIGPDISKNPFLDEFSHIVSYRTIINELPEIFHQGTDTEPFELFPKTSYNVYAKSPIPVEVIVPGVDTILIKPEIVSDGAVDQSNHYSLVEFRPGQFHLILHDPDRQLQAIKNVTDGNKENPQDLVQGKNPLPSLVSDGIKLFKTERSKSEEKLFMPNQSAKVESLYEEDLILGYRVDVSEIDNTKENYKNTASLVAFDFITYSLKHNGETLKFENKEGWITVDSAMQDRTIESQVSYSIPNQLFNWNGFSLSTQFRLEEEAEEEDDERGGEVSNAVEFLQNFLQVKKDPKDQSVIPLRFGSQYSFRMRSVYLNGYGPTTSLGDDICNSFPDKPLFTDPIRYLRSEFVSAPTLILDKPILEGQRKPGTRQYTIKGREGEAVDRLVIRTSRADLELTAETCVRYLYPPQTNYQIAEWHGMFDQLYRKANDQRLSVSERNKTVRTLINYFQVSKNRIEEVQKDVDYLPDPMAAQFRVTVAEVPSLNEGTELRLPEGVKLGELLDRYRMSADDEQKLKFFTVEGWPKFTPWKILLRSKTEDGKYYEVNSSEYTITYYLEPGLELYVDVQSYLPEAAEGLFYAHPDHILPARRFQLIHAVRYPLSDPRIINYTILPRIDTPEDSTKIAIRFHDLAFDRLTTDKLELHSSWKEYIDDPTLEFNPETQQAAQTILEHENILEGLDHYSERDLIIDQHDTKFRTKHFRLKAISRFFEYFKSPEDASTNELFTRIGPYYSDSSELIETQIIRNNKRPEQLVPEYLIPLFAWVRKQDDIIHTSRKSGNQIRIYFKRGIFDTGGEVQVAIKLYRPDDATHEPYSRIGQDITVKRVIASDVNSNAFGFEVNEITAPDNTNFLGYKVCSLHFDQSVKLWYTDIMVPNRKYYFPFVRFVLTKYQPHSEPGKHMSDETITDFCQFAPDRFASLTRLGQSRIEVEVVIADPKGNNIAHRQNNKFIVTLERRLTGSNNDFIWYTEEKSSDFKPWDRPNSADVGVLDDKVKGYIDFSASFDLPNTSDSFRVVIQEFEQHDEGPRLVYMDLFPVY